MILLKNCVIFSDGVVSEGWTEFASGFAVIDSPKGHVVDRDIYRQIIIPVNSKLIYISSDDILSALEISDVANSQREIHEGKAKEFTDVEDFLRELNTE